VLFGKRQLHLKEPMLDITAFRKPFFSIGAILVITIQMVQFSMNVILPMLLQSGLNCTSFTSALVLLPAAVICCVMTLISGKIYDSFGGKVMIPLGLAIMFLALFALSRIQTTTSLSGITLLNILVFFGISLAWSSNQSNALRQLSPNSQAHGVAIINTFIQVGAALGTPLFVGLMDAGQAKYLKQIGAASGYSFSIDGLFAGFQYSITAATVIIAIAFLLSLSFHLEGKTK
jgi:DHA2 family lincomycin resistance protein-like MFS transporter